MSIWVTLEMRVKNGQIEKLIPFLEQNLQNVRGFKGALSVSLYYDEKSRNFLIYEEWQSQKHHQDYIKFIKENGVMNKLMSFMETAPTVNYFSKLPL